MLISNTVYIAQTPDALVQAYARGKRNFSGVNFADETLRSIDLKGVDFSYADFSDADLSRTNLRGVDFSYAVLQATDLSYANLQGTILIGADLRDADLTATNLRGAAYDPQTTRFPTGFDPEQAAMKSDRITVRV